MHNRYATLMSTIVSLSFFSMRLDVLQSRSVVFIFFFGFPCFADAVVVL